MSTTIEPGLEIPPPPSEQLPALPEVPPARRSPASARNVALGLALLWLLTGTYLVGPDQQAVVTRFGRVVEERANTIDLAPSLATILGLDFDGFDGVDRLTN